VLASSWSAGSAEVRSGRRAPAILPLRGSARTPMRHLVRSSRRRPSAPRLCMDLGTTWGHPVHDDRTSCAHPVGGRSSSETSPKPLVPLAETGVELRHRRARRRAGRRRLRHRAGPGDRTRAGPDEEHRGTPSTTAGEREATPAPSRTGRPDRHGARRRARQPSTTTSHPGATWDGGQPGDRRHDGHDDGHGSRGREGRRTDHQPSVLRATAAVARRTSCRPDTSVSTTQSTGSTGGRPPTATQRATAAATGHGEPRAVQHRAGAPSPRRATSDGGAAGDRGDDGAGDAGRGVTPTTDGGAVRETDGGGPGDRTGVEAAQESSAAADAIGGPAGATQHRRATRATARRDEVRRTHGSTEGRPRGRGNPAAGRPDVQRGAPRSHTSRGPAPFARRRAPPGTSVPTGPATSGQRHGPPLRGASRLGGRGASRRAGAPVPA